LKISSENLDLNIGFILDLKVTVTFLLWPINEIKSVAVWAG
tara:strand:+ start:869 stop:991 length:123 start_codon:yes stop_codon:yes gene_type:complete